MEWSQVGAIANYKISQKFLKTTPAPTLFLIETKVNERKMERIRKKCGFDSGIYISAEGSRRGLSLIWKQGISINLISFSKSRINVEVGDVNGMAE